MVIRILDYVRSASSYEDGEIIFRILFREISNNKEVTIDFSGVKSIPSSFVNSAFVRLVEHFSIDQIRGKLTFIESTKQINDLIKSRFQFVSKKD